MICLGKYSVSECKVETKGCFIQKLKTEKIIKSLRKTRKVENSIFFSLSSSSTE